MFAKRKIRQTTDELLVGEGVENGDEQGLLRQENCVFDRRGNRTSRFKCPLYETLWATGKKVCSRGIYSL